MHETRDFRIDVLPWEETYLSIATWTEHSNWLSWRGMNLNNELNWILFWVILDYKGSTKRSHSRRRFVGKKFCFFWGPDSTSLLFGELFYNFFQMSFCTDISGTNLILMKLFLAFRRNFSWLFVVRLESEIPVFFARKESCSAVCCKTSSKNIWKLSSVFKFCIL